MFEKEFGGSRSHRIIEENNACRVEWCTWSCGRVLEAKEKPVKSMLPSEVVEATEDGGMRGLLSLLAAHHSALPTLLHVGPDLGTRVVLQE